MAFPTHRLRRLRQSEGIRRLVGETRVSVDDLIAPIFVCTGKGQEQAIASMPGVSRLSVDMAVDEAERIAEARIPAVLLFGVVPKGQKDAKGKEAWSDRGLVQKTARAIKKRVPDLVVIADTCFCEYTDHGHCGELDMTQGVHNDKTLTNLARTAVSQARAGADVIAPSGMMDGMVKSIRQGLDTAGFEHVAILSYAAKYCSAFYGPFRDAADSAPTFGDRRQYQMAPSQAREALAETLLDVDEGADMVMVKPALAYMDIIRTIREAVSVPIAAYNVSGEYSLVKAAAAKGWIEEERTVLEIMTGMRRAGADMIITYWAKDLAKWLKGA